MELTPLSMGRGAALHSKAIHGAPTEEQKSQGGEKKVCRLQNRLATDEPELADPQEIATADDPQAAFPQAHVPRPPTRKRRMWRPFATPLTQRQPFPQGHEPEGDADTLPDWMHKG